MNLLERESCLEDLSNRLRSVGGSGGCIALISGEAGIGKSALLQAFAARHPEGRFLWGACDALFTPRPLAPLHDVARQTTGALTAALAAGAPREALFAAMLDELDRPLTVLVLEDLHWADEATLDLFKYLGRRIQRTRAMIAATFRDDEVGPRHPLRFVIGDLPRACSHRILPAPLSEAAVESLAHGSGRAARDLHALTGGNPLFVSEVLASDPGTVPVTVRDAVLARTLRLSGAARQLAELVAVVPGRAESWLLRAAGVWDAAAIEECTTVGLVRHPDGGVGYRHELVRRAIQDSLPAFRLQALHAGVLTALASQDTVAAARLAHHAAGAGSDPEVLRWAPLAAAQAAAVGAHREAAAHYQAAVASAASGGPLSADALAALNEGLSYECYLTDQIELAIRARSVALDIWRTAGAKLREGDALRWLSRLSWFAGRRVDASRYAAAAIETLELLPVGAELAMAYSNQAQLDMLGHESAPAIRWAGRAIELAGRCANREILSHALNNLGTARLLAGDPSGWTDLERSLQIALEGGFQEHVARAYTNLSSMAVCFRDYGRASRRLSEGLAYCQEHDLDSWQAYMLAWSARAHFERAEWLEAARAAEGVLRRSHAAPVSRVPALIVLGHLRTRLGDPDATSPLDEAAALAGSIAEIQRAGPLAAARAEARWLAGDADGVADALKEVHDRAGRGDDPWMQGELAIWLWRAGRLGEVPTSGVAAPYALEMAGDWRAAAEQWRTLGCPYERALVLGWCGDESAQREALALFEGLGTEPAAEGLRRRMKSLGVRKVPRGARASTQDHPFGLTRREAQILGHMRDGLRNAAIAKALYLSTRTVDHHVSSILAKLGVGSRAEAIEIARQQPESTA